MKRDLSIWYCEACKSIHFRKGDILMTFTPAEFIDFASEIGDIYGRAYLEVYNQQQNPNYFELDSVC